MAAVRHLGFLDIQIFNCDTVFRVNMYHNTIFRTNRLSRCRDMAIPRFLKMATDRHLGFLKV